MIPTSPTKSELPWWKLRVSTWLFLGGLAVLSAACCFRPSMVDAIALAVGRMLDFRYWPWWFVFELLLVLAFSVRWFLIFAGFYNQELTETEQTEAKCFIALTVLATVTMFSLAALECLELLRPAYFALYGWFGFGTFSFVALAVFAALLVLFAAHLVLAWNWVVAFQNRR